MTAGAMPETPPAPTLSHVLAKVEELLSRRAYAEHEVLTVKELCQALKISKDTLFKTLSKLPVSYALGPQSPRVIWGDVLQYLRDTNINKN